MVQYTHIVTLTVDTDDKIPRHWIFWTREQNSGIPQLVHSVGDRCMRSLLSDPSLRQVKPFGQKSTVLFIILLLSILDLI